MSLSTDFIKLILAMNESGQKLPGKIKMKYRLIKTIKEDFSIQGNLERFMGIPVEELSEGNKSILILEE